MRSPSPQRVGFGLGVCHLFAQMGCLVKTISRVDMEPAGQSYDMVSGESRRSLEADADKSGAVKGGRCPRNQLVSGG
ncbi:hypothetical protein QC762_611020 [Podospora pseudocomata]|uniref:Uncharacterized protein n=1 Tax=Podospora pseudocomata TaxID=2093779 RepID=A0ABR0G9I4_9PEZI|nr:hypothetical protein QC762_611020 [Podospora pseudocomata]